MTTETPEAPPKTGLHIQVLQENLERGLSLIKPAIPGKSTLPILSHVCVSTDYGRLRLDTTDLDVAISAWVGAKVDNEGAICLPHKFLHDMVRTMPPVTVCLEDNGKARVGGRTPGPQCKMLAARSETMITGMDAVDFPRISDEPGELWAEISPRDFAAAVRYVEGCAASDDSRPVLAGVLVGRIGSDIVLTTADGYRIATYPIRRCAGGATLGGFKGDGAVIIPIRAMRIAAKLFGSSASTWRRNPTDPIEFSVNKTGTMAIFQGTDVRMVVQVIQGTYPNYRALIPQPFGSDDNSGPGEVLTTATVSRDRLAANLKQAGVVLKQGSGIVRFYVADAETLRIEAHADTLGDFKVEVDADVKGEIPGKIAFHVRYVEDALAVADPEVEIGITSPTSQGVFRSGEAVTVIMPMFVQWEPS